ncbi:hypothetical protein F7725_000054 [Dissostichus mawsoni]|uniref:Uncharacterized protein n=1 Tax=Dissostichus mawsoni TaxID=36200 RepID=A0A7J5ZFL5_DISMA|nr:hypothetical protein F7725_000054 [Dissostichus mawsoni]
MLPPGAAKKFFDYEQKVFSPYILSQLEHVSRVDVVWDEYFTESLKAETRSKRGKGVQFLCIEDNKAELFSFLATSEADTRILLRLGDALKEGYSKVSICTVDTDVVAHQTLSYFSALLLCTLCHCYPRLCYCWCIPFIIIGLSMTLAEVMQSTACHHHSFTSGEGGKFHIRAMVPCSSAGPLSHGTVLQYHPTQPWFRVPVPCPAAMVPAQVPVPAAMVPAPLPAPAAMVPAPVPAPAAMVPASEPDLTAMFPAPEPANTAMFPAPEPAHTAMIQASVPVPTAMVPTPEPTHTAMVPAQEPAHTAMVPAPEPAHTAMVQASVPVPAATVPAPVPAMIILTVGPMFILKTALIISISHNHNQPQCTIFHLSYPRSKKHSQLCHKDKAPLRPAQQRMTT